MNYNNLISTSSEECKIWILKAKRSEQIIFEVSFLLETCQVPSANFVLKFDIKLLFPFCLDIVFSFKITFNVSLH